MVTDTARDVEELALELEGPDLPQETYLDAVGRITNAWMTAREIVTAEIPPPRSDEAEGWEEPSQAETEWVPVVEDPQHPFWQRLRRREMGEQEADQQA